MPSAGHDAEPLLVRGRLVSVDAHPVCAVCGAAVTPAPAGRWVHVPAGRPFHRRSRWFGPVRWPVLRALPTYGEFTERYPWTVRPELCGGAVTTEADWREGVRRLRDYHALLTAARRRRALAAGQNPYLDLVQVLAGRQGRGWAVPGGLASVLDLPARRRELAALFAWAIPDAGALAVLARYAPLLECGAGTGYWAALLRASGVDVEASRPDPAGRSREHATTTATASAMERGAGGQRGQRGAGQPRAHPVSVLAAHDDDDASYRALRAYRGDVLVYVGGGPDGPTGTVRFHRELALNWRAAEQALVPNWPGLRDRLVVYRRNRARLPLAARDRCADCRRFIPTGTAGRCDACFARRPPAMALRVNGHRVEYPPRGRGGHADGAPAGLRAVPALIRPPLADPAAPPG